MLATDLETDIGIDIAYQGFLAAYLPIIHQDYHILTRPETMERDTEHSIRVHRCTVRLHQYHQSMNNDKAMQVWRTTGSKWLVDLAPQNKCIDPG